MEATRKRKQSHCVHTAEDGTQCGKTIALDRQALQKPF